MGNKGGVKLFKNEQRLFLTTEERHRFRSATSTLDIIERAFCRFMYYTGCKLGEGLDIYPNQIIARDGFFLIKNGEMLLERSIPVPPALQLELSIYFNLQTRSGTRPLWTMSRTKGWRIICKVMKKSGIKGKHATPTGLRHSFAISCLEVCPQIPLSQIQKWLGHKSLDLTLSYFKAFRHDEEIKNLDHLWEHI
jgi:integrase